MAGVLVDLSAGAVTITFLVAGAIVVLASLAGLAWGVPAHMEAPGAADES